MANDESFGPGLPPLDEFIAKTLKDYPSGQIFKVQLIGYISLQGIVGGSFQLMYAHILYI